MLPDLSSRLVTHASAPRLSIIIVNFNAEELVLRCLQAVYASGEALDCEVIVVDNASGDGSAAAVEQTFPQVNLIRNTQNAGCARANNQALHLARGC